MTAPSTIAGTRVLAVTPLAGESTGDFATRVAGQVPRHFMSAETGTAPVDRRAAVMAGRYAGGETLDSIAQSYGLTRERVRQIVEASGLATATDARHARRAAREAKDNHDRARLIGWLEENPGRTREVAARALGCAQARIGELLGEAARRLLVEEKTSTEVYSDDDLLAFLRAAAQVHGNPLAADSYDAFCANTGSITSVRIIQRFGTWNAACRAAGLRVNPGRPSYTRRWTEAQMLEHVADYLASDACPGSYAGYDRYARATPGAPSAQTVRNAFRSWTNAKAAAHQILAARARRQRATLDGEVGQTLAPRVP